MATTTTRKRSTGSQAKAGRARQAKARQAKAGNGGRAGTAKEKAALELQALTETNRKKGHTGAMQKDARRLAKKAGVDVPGWAAEKASGNSAGPRRSKGKEEDVEAAAIATDAAAAKGSALSQKLRPVEIAAIRKAIAKLGDPKDTPALLGFKSEAAMRKVVTGELAQRDAGDYDLMRSFHEKVKTHQLWMRKALAGAWGVYQQAKS